MLRGAQYAVRGVVACGLLSLASSVPAQAAQVTRGNLTISYQDVNDAKQLALVFRAFQKASADLKALGLSVPKVQIIAAQNATNFAQLTGEPASIAASTYGSTIYTQRLTALAARGTLINTIRHESFHTAQPSSLPRWLAEGLARLFSGEANRDPTGRTGLENLTSAQLNEQLLSRTPGETGRAYAEASRRARIMLEKVGWQRALQ